MPIYEGNITSKLPNAGTSIFAVMSKLANDHGAVNLSQGFPDFPISEKLIARVNHFMKKGFNQYAPMPGVPALRQAISDKAFATYGMRYDPNDEVTVTAGATQALFTAIAAFIREGDEAIIFEPAYDSYAPAVRANGGLVKYADLKLPDFHIDWSEVIRMVSNRTRLIIINTPHNPTGSLLSAADLTQLETLTRNTDILVISDEVYEHLIFDGMLHQSVCRFPELAQRSLVIGSFGKTFHATGWKTGFVMAPARLTEEFRKMHQFVVFASNTPVQHALAEFLGDEENYLHLGKFYQQKRDFFAQQLETSRFKVVPCYGTYFQLLDYSAISDENELDYAKRLVVEHGIASVPLSPFYTGKTDQNLLRFCFAKKEETLQKAAEILCRI